MFFFFSRARTMLQTNHIGMLLYAKTKLFHFIQYQCSREFQLYLHTEWLNQISETVVGSVLQRVL